MSRPKKNMFHVIKPLYDLGMEVFTVDTLTKGYVLERVYVEQQQVPPNWYYKLIIGNDPHGNPIVSQQALPSEALCLKLEAKEILEDKAKDINTD